MASGAVEDGLWLRAERQTAGRGRQGRAWVSEPGNLYASTAVRLRPSDPPGTGLAFVAAMALAEAVSGIRRPGEGPDLSVEITASADDGPGLRAGDGLTLKWPNDLLLNGAKVAGILLERAGDWVVAGFGVNCAHAPDLPDRATVSLAAAGRTVDPGELIEGLAARFAHWVAVWRGEGFAPVRARWLALAHPPGTPLVARLPGGGEAAGAFETIDGDGALILRLAEGGTRAIHAGDIVMIRG